MKKFYSILTNLLLFIFLLLFSSTNFAALPAEVHTIAPMLKNVLPAIVNIRAQIKITDIETLQEIQKQRGAQPEDNNGKIPSTYVSVASGVIVDAIKGYILTNAHVINGAQTVVVTLSDGRHFTAKIIGADKASDVALIQIKAKNLTAVSIGDSNKLKVGDFVAAIGNPFGLNQSVTSGIVSALKRAVLGIENYENFIQTDAPINPGNSGGALINLQGQLIGINTAILGSDKGSIGIGFAIPINMATSVMQQFLQYGDVKRGVLGIGAQDLTPELATAFNLESTNGAVVTFVLPFSPAAHGGLQPGDIIRSINNVEIKNANDVVNFIGFLRVDSKISINLLRNNKSMTASVTLSDPKKRKESIEQNSPFLYGVGLKKFSLLSPIYGQVNGILVTSVNEDSNAWRADLRPGDVITSANQQKVTTVDELTTQTTQNRSTLLLNVLRGNNAVFLVITKEET